MTQMLANFRSSTLGRTGLVAERGANHKAAMNGVLFPVATTAEAALKAPIGRAAREREARAIGEAAHRGFEVRFVTEAMGPGYATRDEALDAYRGRLDDERKGKTHAVAPEDRWCDLREVMAPGQARMPKSKPLKPAFKDGRRWPAPLTPPTMVWRLSISYWKVVDPKLDPVAKQARAARRRASGEGLDPETIRELSAAPLRPLKPQMALDIGLFEVRAPEDPGLVLPDE